MIFNFCYLHGHHLGALSIHFLGINLDTLGNFLEILYLDFSRSSACTSFKMIDFALQANKKWLLSQFVVVWVIVH